MKILQKTAIRVIFLLAVLFCFGSNTYSGYSSQSYCLELSGESNSAGNSLLSDTDASDNDQIDQTDNLTSLVEPICLILTAKNPFLIPNLSFSIWQPPKI
jgi:hypothetical protein